MSAMKLLHQQRHPPGPSPSAFAAVAQEPFDQPVRALLMQTCRTHTIHVQEPSSVFNLIGVWAVGIVLIAEFVLPPLQSEGQEATADATAAKAAPAQEQNGTAEAESRGSRPPRPDASTTNLAELSKRKQEARRKEEAGAAREGQLTNKERRATGMADAGCCCRSGL